MAKILQFPAPTPEPPVPSMRMPRPVAPIRTNAVSIHVVPAPAMRPAAHRTPFLERITA